MPLLLPNSSSIWSIWKKKTYFNPIWICLHKFSPIGFWTRCCVFIWFDVVFSCMTLVPPSTNNVYICQFPPTLTRWTGHVTVPIRKKNVTLYKVSLAPWHCAAGRCAAWTAGQSGSGSSGSSFLPWFLITARCGICFRRIMFPILTTVLSSPGDLYNCTECDPDVWIPSHSCVGMCTVQ